MDELHEKSLLVALPFLPLPLDDWYGIAILNYGWLEGVFVRDFHFIGFLVEESYLLDVSKYRSYRTLSSKELKMCRGIFDLNNVSLRIECGSLSELEEDTVQVCDWRIRKGS
jgi:hypothetical protein